jgi:cobalamin biosynthesis protein CbiD
MTPTTQSLTLTENLWHVPIKKAADIDTGTMLMFGIFFVFFFLYMNSGSGSTHSSNSQKSTSQLKKWVKLDDASKNISDQIRNLEMSIKWLALKKREMEGEIRKIEMNSISSIDADGSYDNELKLDKLRMKIEEIEMMEEKKHEELNEAHNNLAHAQQQDLL